MTLVTVLRGSDELHPHFQPPGFGVGVSRLFDGEPLSYYVAGERAKASSGAGDAVRYSRQWMLATLFCYLTYLTYTEGHTYELYYTTPIQLLTLCF